MVYVVINIFIYYYYYYYLNIHCNSNMNACNNNVVDRDLLIWAKIRFMNKQHKRSVNHPIISSLKRKADDNYMEVLNKYSLTNDECSINQFRGVTLVDKCLYMLHKQYHNVKFALWKTKMKFNQYIIMSNLQMESTLGIANSRNRIKVVKLDSTSNIIKEKLLTFIRLVCQIKPEAPKIKGNVYKYYPTKSLIYSDYISNHYWYMKMKYNLSSFKIIGITFSVIALYKLYSLRLKGYVKYNHKDIVNENKINDILDNITRYKKIGSVFTENEDQKYLNILLTNRTNMHTPVVINTYTKQLNTLHKQLKFINILTPLCVYIYSRKRIHKHNVHTMIMKVFGSYIISNELTQYIMLTLRTFQSKYTGQDKLTVFKKHLLHTYVPI